MIRRGSRRLAGARRQFRTSSRYSRFVDWLRVVLPATALALVAVLVLWPQLTGGSGGPIMPMIAGGEIANADSMRMHNPRYIGRTSGAEPYTVTAGSATLDPGDPDLVHLDHLDAGITTADRRDVRLAALSGVYDRATDRLDLGGGTELQTSDGYRFETESAHVNLKAGQVDGDRPVAGTGPTGDLEADRFRIREGGDVLHFEGRVKVTIQPQPRSNLGS